MASDSFAVTDGDVIKVFCFITLNSGTAPFFEITDSAGGTAISNVATSADGVNVMTLTATSTDGTSFLNIRNANAAAANFETSPIYVFKV